MSARSFLLLGALLAVITACDHAPRDDERGFLYFGSGRYLGKLDLSDGSSTIAANAGDVNIIEVSAGRGNTVLLGVTAPSGYLEVDRILRVDVTTGRRASLYSGKMARYLPGTNTVIYDDGHQLLAVGTVAGNPVLLAHSQNAVTAIVVVSGDEVLFEVRDDKASRIYRYNARTGSQQELPVLAAVCELAAAVWIESVDRLACSARDTQQLLLASIDGTDAKAMQLPNGKSFRPLAFAAGQNAIILSENWQSWLAGRPRVAIWMYYVDEQRSERLFKDQEIGRSVVYSRF